MTPRTAAASLLFLLVLGLGTAGCRGPRARSERSFDEIQRLARGKTAEQVRALLGEPDSRQVVFDGDERWIWWNYTFLDGSDCPPEMRGRVVHLEIVIKNPERTHERRRPYSEWQVDDAFGITYRAPFTDG
jgi:ribulose bisphosphate carboxylase small subunit